MKRDTAGLFLHSTASDVSIRVEEHAKYPGEDQPYWVINIKVGHHDLHVFTREKPTFDVQLDPVPKGWDSVDTSHD